MRRRLSLLVLAVTSLVVVAFTVPLAFLVHREADARARSTAERQAQAVAAGVVRVVVSGGGDIDLGAIAAEVAPLPAGISIVVPDAAPEGEEARAPALVRAAADRRESLSAYGPDGEWELALPVLTRRGSVVVLAQVPAEELARGVIPAWSLLGVLGVGLIVASLFLANRLGRFLVEPVDRLAEAATRLGAGDLDTRVHVEEPAELAQVAAAFNSLAPRLQELIDTERESVADISHRLRTPLTTVRLQAESLADPREREEVLAQIDRLQIAVDEVIAEARRRPREGPARSDLAAATRSRLAFWGVLAEEQGRQIEIEVPEGPVGVPVSATELGAAIDALIGNVFTHSAPGAGFSVTVDPQPPSLVVEDDGGGFPEGLDPTARGESGVGSSGLGLDIVKRLAERCRGGVVTGRSPTGGARVEVRFGPDSSTE